jgi:hypothetical protein
VFVLCLMAVLLWHLPSSWWNEVEWNKSYSRDAKCRNHLLPRSFGSEGGCSCCWLSYIWWLHPERPDSQEIYYGNMLTMPIDPEHRRTVFQLLRRKEKKKYSELP